jgi:thiosulfate/3-mercaptopyruvate sulfurtransferase
MFCNIPMKVDRMKLLSTLAAGVVFAAAATAATLAVAQPLLSPAALQAKLSDANVRVIDIRDPKSYAANHIPGSLNAPYGKWRGPANNPGDLPDLPKLTALVQSLGLTPSTHAVVVSSGADATDFGASARVYWTLKVLGLTDLSVLNGGLKGWMVTGLPQNSSVSSVVASSFQPQIDTRLVATKEELVQRIQSGDSVLIDARPADFFEGNTRHAGATVPGTLPGAVNLENSKWFVPGTSNFVDLGQAQQIAADSPIDPAKETVSFCNTGHWAATNWFAMSEVLGQKNVKMYAGSMVEWSKDPSGLPMANVPSRPKQLLIDVKLWAAKTF